MASRPPAPTPSGTSAAPPPAGSRARYSPHRRTAVVLTGTGTAGAYHAGVLRALHEAGVKVDLMAGRGIGTVGALFGAVDGADQLWERSGLWAAPGAARLYRWRPAFGRGVRGPRSRARHPAPSARGGRPRHPGLRDSLLRPDRRVGRDLVDERVRAARRRGLRPGHAAGLAAAGHGVRPRRVARGAGLVGGADVVPDAARAARARGAVVAAGGGAARRRLRPALVRQGPVEVGAGGLRDGAPEPRAVRAPVHASALGQPWPARVPRAPGRRARPGRIPGSRPRHAHEEVQGAVLPAPGRGRRPAARGVGPQRMGGAARVRRPRRFPLSAGGDRAVVRAVSRRERLARRDASAVRPAGRRRAPARRGGPRWRAAGHPGVRAAPALGSPRAGRPAARRSRAHRRVAPVDRGGGGARCGRQPGPAVPRVLRDPTRPQSPWGRSISLARTTSVPTARGPSRTSWTAASTTGTGSSSTRSWPPAARRWRRPRVPVRRPRCRRGRERGATVDYRHCWRFASCGRTQRGTAGSCAWPAARCLRHRSMG